jgi:hypothetical protein
MSSSPNTAPWQLAPVSAAPRVAAAALAVIAIDSTFAWQSMPLLASIAFLIIPLLVAIRVVRGFPGSLSASAVTLGATAALAGRGLVASTPSRPAYVSSALLVAAIVSAVGLAAVAVAWWGRRQQHAPIIAIEITDSGEFAVVRSWSRRARNRTYR